jgi:hypothetical protein
MIDSELPETQVLFVSKHRFLVLVGGAIVISLILVAISLDIYNKSGAAQLDLSRPGYRSVSSEAISSDNSFVTYSSSGPVTPETIKEFESIYNKQSSSINTIDAYGGDPLSPDALQISAPVSNQ